VLFDQPGRDLVGVVVGHGGRTITYQVGQKVTKA
jgi:hypothetical protein